MQKLDLCIFEVHEKCMRKTEWFSNFCNKNKTIQFPSYLEIGLLKRWLNNIRSLGWAKHKLTGILLRRWLDTHLQRGYIAMTWDTVNMPRRKRGLRKKHSLHISVARAHRLHLQCCYDGKYLFRWYAGDSPRNTIYVFNQSRTLLKNVITTQAKASDDVFNGF